MSASLKNLKQNKPILKWAFSLGGGIAVVATLLVWTPHFFIESGLPVYAKNLPDDVKLASSEFNQRVQALSLLGIAEGQLRNMLTTEAYSLSNQEKLATIERAWLGCNLKWTLTWAIDSAGKVTQVDGRFTENCQ